MSSYMLQWGKPEFCLRDVHMLSVVGFLERKIFFHLPDNSTFNGFHSVSNTFHFCGLCKLPMGVL